MALKDKVKSKGFWAVVATAVGSFLAGNNTPVDVVRSVIEALVK